MPRIGQDPGKKQGAPKPRRRKAASSRPLVLAPGAKWDPKTRRATAPKRKPSPVFKRGLPQPGAHIRAETRRATQRSGRAVAKTPGVRRELKPVRRPSSQRERADLIRSTRQAVARLGLTEGQKSALAQSDTPAGLRLRQAQRAQQGGYKRASRESATQMLLRSTGSRGLRPKELSHVRFDRLDPSVRRDIDRVARDIRRSGNRAVAKPGRDRRTHLGPVAVDLRGVKRAAAGAVRAAAGATEEAKRGVGAASRFLQERTPGVDKELVKHRKGGSGGGLAAVLAAGAQPNVTGGAIRLGENAAKDLADFPMQSVQALYEMAAAGVEAAQGRTKRAKRLASGLSHGAVGELLIHGNPRRASQQLFKHPYYSALEASGLYAAAGRGAGGVARSGALGRRVRRAANTSRADLVIVPGSNLRVKRSYSKNLITQGLQKRGEARARKQGRDPNVVPPEKVDRYLNAEGDAFTSYAENKRRFGKEQEARAFDRQGVPTRRGSGTGSRWDRMVASADRSLGVPKVTVRGKVRTRRAEQYLISFLVENRLGPAIRPGDVKGSLRSIEKRLEKVASREDLSAGARRANAEQRAAIRAVIDSPKALANLERTVAAATYVSHRSRALERKLIKQHAVTRKQTQAARERPYAVERMGARFNPNHTPYEEAVTRHGDLKVVEGRARATERAARKEHRAARLDLARVMGAARRSAGEGRGALILKAAPGAPKRSVGVLRYLDAVEKLDPKAAAKFAKREAKDTARVAAARGRVAVARQARTDARKARVAATRARRQATPKRYVQGLEIGGKRVTLAEITAARKAEGLPEPGFLTHRRDTRGARSYFVNWFDTRRTPDAKARTGEATRVGAQDVSIGAVKDSLVRQRGLVDAIDTFDEFIGNSSVKRPDGKRFTWDEAQRAAGHYAKATGIPMVPVRMGPGRYGDAVLDELSRIQGGGALQHIKRGGLPNADQALADAASSALERMLQAPAQDVRGARNVVLVPEQSIKRYSEHQLLGMGAAGQAAQKLTSVFRGTVLSLSTKWLFGNVAEAVLRSVFNGVTPYDVVVGRRLMAELRKLDQDAADKMFVQTQQGLLFGGSRNLNVHREAPALAGTIMQKPAVRIGQAARLPVIRQGLAAVDHYQQLVFGVNKAVERAFQQGVIGKQARHDIQELTDSWGKSIRASKPALQDVARGLVNTPAQVKYARTIDEVLGKYTRFSPTTRKLTQVAAPFLPWYLNAMRFVYWTLPRHHPVKTALLTNVVAAMNEDFKTSTEDAPEGDLRSALRTKDGGFVNVARYTPFGAFTSGVEGVLDPFYPQLSSIAKIAMGQNFTGRKLEISPDAKVGDRATQGQRIAIALNAFLESIIPGLAIARRVQEQGRTGYDNSTVLSPRTKPGSAHSSPLDIPGIGKAGNRILNPLRPTYLRNPVPKAGSVKLSPEQQSLIRQAQQYRQAGGASGAELESLRRQAEAYARMAK